MYVVPPQTTLFTPEYALLHYACVSFTYNNKMKIHDSLKITETRYEQKKLMLTNPRDAFGGQSRSQNMVHSICSVQFPTSVL